MPVLSDDARAKVNLTLRVNGRRADGYHDLESVVAFADCADRLTLTPARVAGMADGIAVVRGVADPIGVVTESWQRPNGMTIERVRTPLGVIGVIYTLITTGSIPAGCCGDE